MLRSAAVVVALVGRHRVVLQSDLPFDVLGEARRLDLGLLVGEARNICVNCRRIWGSSAVRSGWFRATFASPICTSLAASSSENVMPWLRTSSKSFCALSPNRDDACACATGGDAGVGPGIGCPFAFATGGALGAAAVAGAASSRASGRRNASAITRPMTRTASPPINPSVRTRMRATRSPSRAYTGRWFFSRA